MGIFDKQTNNEKFFELRDKELETLIDTATGKVKAELVNKVSCLVCEANNYSYLFSKNGFDFVRCQECHHVYVNPQLREEDITSHYGDESETSKLIIDFVASEKQKELRYQVFDYFFNKIQPSRPTGKVLDIGCSIGQFLKYSEEKGYDALGLELNEHAIEFANKNYGVKIEKKLLHECNFPNESFDVISMFGVIEHLPKPVDVISDVYRLLKPGGYFIGICPNVQSLVCMILHEQSRTFTGRLHLSYFSDDTLRLLAEKVGFKNENVDIDNCYSGTYSMINHAQFLDPFGDETYEFLPKKFKEFLLDKSNVEKLEEKMNELGIGLKLRFIMKKEG